MADGVDTSSYPKPPALPTQKGVLDQVKDYQQVESSNIAISQAKLKQVNDQFNLMNSELAILANDPSVTKEQAAQRLLNISNTFGFKPEITQHMLGELRAAPDVPTFAKTAITRGMQTMEKVNTLYGTPGVYSQGQQDTPVVTSPFFGQRPTNPPIQRQIPPTQPVIGPDNRQTLQGPTAPIAPPGVAPGPGLPVQGRTVPAADVAPAVRPPPTVTLPANSNALPTTPDTIAPSAVVQSRFPAPSGPAVGQTPLYEEGLKAYTQDQAASGAKMLAAKPAIQALPLMQTPGFLSGPLTDQFTKVVAGLKSSGLIKIADNADPTAIRQEAAKKLYQYVSASPVGQRSDAAQTLKEASSPNPNVQILPALIKLTKDSIALDRIEAAMPQAFKGKDFENYVKHKGTFPQSIDEKAFTLDLEPEETRTKIVDGMAEKLKSKNSRERNAAEKFFKSLRVAKEAGFYQ